MRSTCDWQSGRNSFVLFAYESLQRNAERRRKEACFGQYTYASQELKKFTEKPPMNHHHVHPMQWHNFTLLFLCAGWSSVNSVFNERICWRTVVWCRLKIASNNSMLDYDKSYWRLSGRTRSPALDVIVLNLAISKVCVSGCSVGCGRADRVRRSLTDRLFTSQNPPRGIRGVRGCGFGDRCWVHRE